jgi:hypothetical protein
MLVAGQPLNIALYLYISIFKLYLRYYIKAISKYSLVIPNHMPRDNIILLDG